MSEQRVFARHEVERVGRAFDAGVLDGLRDDDAVQLEMLSEEEYL